MKGANEIVVVGGGHNGLVAAAYLARAGRRVTVLERLDHVGGAATSSRVFPGVDARLSRYSYLVSLLPRAIVRDLGLGFETIQRRVLSATPYADGRSCLVVRRDDPAATAEGFRALTGSDAELGAWERLSEMLARLGRRLFPTLTEPLRSRDEIRELVDDEHAWEALFERPLGELIERELAHDVTRGIVRTDGLVGTFAAAGDASLAQNRCFLYHIIGNGTGDWDVPRGGMGALTDALARCAREAGAALVTGAVVTRVHAGDAGCEVEVEVDGRPRVVPADVVLAGCAPAELARLLGEPAPAPAPEGAQLKINMLVTRLPRLRSGVDPADAFAGTLHVGESYEELERAYREAAGGRIPSRPPSEVYCHTLSDASIIAPDLRAAGCHTLTLFGLHMPARLFRDDNDAARATACERTLAVLDEALEDPIASVLARDANGAPCIEVRTPLDVERDVGLPGGNIFHRDLQWPFAEDEDEVGTWGVETGHPRVLLCGAGARRGGGVSGIPGHNAARRVLAGPGPRHPGG